MTFKAINILLTLCLILSFYQIHGQKTPKSVDEAVEYFENGWSKKEKKEFLDKSEDTAVVELHFSTGMWIRNNWIRGRKNNNLIEEFKELGIFHPDDMSSIILTSLHRKLNGLPLNIKV